MTPFDRLYDFLLVDHTVSIDVPCTIFESFDGDLAIWATGHSRSLTQCRRVTDRQTDRWTDRHLATA